MQQRHIQVTWLRRNDDCADDWDCPAISDIADPEALYFISDDPDAGPNSFRFPHALVPELAGNDGKVRFTGTPCDDADVVAAHASRMAPHETLYRVRRQDIPAELLEAVTPR